MEAKNLEITEKDKEKFVEFLNFSAENTITKNLEWKDTIKFVELLTYMQQMILPKLKHAAEPKKSPMAAPSAPKAIDPEPEEAPRAKKKTRKKTVSKKNVSE